MKKIISMAVLATFATIGFSALAEAPNPHKARDARYRACTKLADDQQLAGDARSAFIASCVKGK